MRVTAIIAAGGAGRRLGAAVPKQLLDVAGQSMLARSVRAFDTHPEVHDIIVALPAELVDGARSRVGEVKGGIVFVAGGTTRQDSVARAFDRVSRRDRRRARARRGAAVRDAGRHLAGDRRGGGARCRDCRDPRHRYGQASGRGRA